MAKFTKTVDGVTGEITNTLNFMGKDFTEVWKENNTFCDCGIEALVSKAFPDFNEEDCDSIQEITCLDEDELLMALAELTEYERTE